MELLLRGKYVLASAAETRVLTDAAVWVSGDTVAEVGDWSALRQAHPDARVVGNGKQLLLPGLIDAHSHGRAISPVQKGVLNDYLENNLLDWAIMPPFDPELTAALGVVRHVRSGGTTIDRGRSTSASAPSAPISTAASGWPSHRACAMSTSWCSTPRRS